jgi:hypothetical protein
MMRGWGNRGLAEANLRLGMHDLFGLAQVYVRRTYHSTVELSNNVFIA